ncbi:MAG: hypothetical protein H6736_15910 [Alphaproteobacteria bacterium]|nr:hypothetical protein [Alphaproteobacteria bacterium]MCB9693297.1 hypothetical protein [Alphaproteobacteria bacterium]
MLLLSLANALAGPCDRISLNSDFSAVENAYLKGDRAALGVAMRDVRRHVGCEEATPVVAHRFHISNALEDASAGDWSAAEEHLRAAVAALPTQPLQGMLAADPRLRMAFFRAQERGVTWTLGSEATTNGQVWSLHPDTAVLERGSRRGARTAAILGAAAIGMYGAAWGVRSLAYDPGPTAPKGKVLGAYYATNGLSVASVATGTLAVGVLVGAYAR